MPVVAKTVARLRVTGDDLEPSEITRLLASRPDRAYARGDEMRPSAKGVTRLARSGSWSVRSPDREPGDLDAQIAELLARCTRDLAAWASVRSRFRIDLFCGLFLGTVNDGIVVAPATMIALGERGIELDLDIYGPTRDATPAQ